MTEICYVKIKGVEIAEIVEFPLESDNTLSLEVLVSQFPRASQLKYLNKVTDKVNTVPRISGRFLFSSKLRTDELLFFSYGLDSIKTIGKETIVKKKPQETLESIVLKFPKTFDLLVIGLSYDTTEESLTKYLSRFGGLIYCKLKIDAISKENKGLAFFRFKEPYYQNRCLNATHLIDKTMTIIKIPQEKLVIRNDPNYKIYVYNISPSITREELRLYFSQFGMIIDISKPADKRSYAFITFCDQLAVTRVFAYGQHHAFNGGRVSVNKVVAHGQYRNQANVLKFHNLNKMNGLKRMKKEFPDKNQKQIRIDSFVDDSDFNRPNALTNEYMKQCRNRIAKYQNDRCNAKQSNDPAPAINQNPQLSTLQNYSNGNNNQTMKNFANLYQPVQNFGNTWHAPLPDPNTGSSIPIPTAFPPPNFYQNNQQNHALQSSNAQQYLNNSGRQSHTIPNHSMNTMANYPS